MFTEAHYEAVLKFFYFMLLDEGLALTAALDAVKRIQKTLKKERTANIELVMIQTMNSVLNSYRRSRKNYVLSTPARSQFKISNLDHLVQWKEFMKKGDDDLAVAVVLRYILGYKPELMSEGLQVPMGTVFYRIRHALETIAAVA